MPLDSDVVLVGTGVAPLVAAYHLSSQGASVLVLNSDNDFFQERSELPFEMFWPGRTRTLDVESLKLNLSESTFENLKPSFPGSIEFWSADRRGDGFHDVTAPHVRERDQLWAFSGYEVSAVASVRAEWETIENLFVEASDRDLNPEILSGVQLFSRFPGAAREEGDYKALWVPRFCDVDVARYCNGVLEFVRERLGESRVLCNASQLEITNEGVRFNTSEGAQTARAKEVWVFWTPRLTPWVQNRFDSDQGIPQGVRPEGIRTWEEWSVVSRDRLQPRALGNYKGMAVWADIEGRPDHVGCERLNVLRPGAMLPVGRYGDHLSWAAEKSFEDLSDLCRGFLGWSGFSIRSMKPRALFEWSGEVRPEQVQKGNVSLRLIPQSDGALVQVVKKVRSLCETFGEHT